MERDLVSEKFPIGSTLPKFSLPNIDGNNIGSDYLMKGKGSVVVFSCNHCPYVKGSDLALSEIASRFQERGIKFVAISSNDAAQYPDDSFEKMKVKAQEMKLPFPYLYDETQEVAKLFDAACTPECYVFDETQTLVFHGTINNSPRFPNEVKDHFLANALEQLLAGQKPNPSFVHPIGCSIKWK
jgi:peroxiredoxin